MNDLGLSLVLLAWAVTMLLAFVGAYKFRNRRK